MQFFALLVFATLFGSTDNSLVVSADSAACRQHHLTWRWTSGEAIRVDVPYPPAAALLNQPFLTDPETLSVEMSKDRMGTNLTLRLGVDAARILGGETAKHVRQQMLIMLDDRVIIAAIVREPIKDDWLSFHITEDREQLTQLRQVLRGIRSDCLVSSLI